MIFVTVSARPSRFHRLLKHLTRLLQVTVAAAFLSAPSLTFAVPEARTYTLMARPAGAVADRLRELYGKAELSVSAMGQQLVVRGEPVVLDEVGELIATMDVAPVQMKIEVRSGAVSDGVSSSGGASVTNNGVSIGGTSRTISTQSQTVRSIVVQDGQSAHITNGSVQMVPFALQGGRNPALALAQVEQRSGFLVSPQVISDQQIELRIMAFENDGAPLKDGFKTEAIMTYRQVAPGTWVSLGGVDQSYQQEGTSGFKTYRVEGKDLRRQSFDVRVQLMN